MSICDLVESKQVLVLSYHKQTKLINVHCNLHSKSSSILGTGRELLPWLGSGCQEQSKLLGLCGMTSIFKVMLHCTDEKLMFLSRFSLSFPSMLLLYVYASGLANIFLTQQSLDRLKASNMRPSTDMSTKHCTLNESKEKYSQFQIGNVLCEYIYDPSLSHCLSLLSSTMGE